MVGGGSEGFGRDGGTDNGGWEKERERERGGRDIRDWLGGERKGMRDERAVAEKVRGGIRDETLGPGSELEPRQHADMQEPPADAKREALASTMLPDSTTALKAAATTTPPPPPPPQIFRNLTIYLNGSTSPLISDHKIKQLFVTHGGSVSLALSRRTVTHVILGVGGEKSTGGLAAGKIQKEIRKVRGEAVKYVTAQWVVDSVKAGRRMGEGRYVPSNLGIGGRGQRCVGGVGGMFT